MSKSKQVQHDPTLPKTPVTIGDKTYDLCFDLGALAEAEQQLIREGHKVNLLAALPSLNLSNLRIVFAAAIRRFHPDVSYEQAMALITLDTVYPVATAIADAWAESLPKADPADPTRPGE